ncbi:juvenile hormone esterase-like [Drosophila sulfurigaster albostrigata]|uniref:juvenile hormone esterase-like n=1 Tax=Drosophila sulfurigaster albostrigata TaxID=89887 RepID=UPI002D21E312|nr:juvenile hormone esterase-like [Drosophila sulfurigaster albostrigata]
MFSLFVIACLCFHSGVLGVDVDLDLGRIHGVNLTSRLGVPFHAFRGIRYAEPPLGELRFKNPKPVKPWAPATFDASQDGPMCPQPWDNMTDVSEDCLRLNVYTKNLNKSARLPVIVFLHPGGFYVFSGQSKYLAGPANLMDRDCVLVSLNYRLGTLGFLATDSADAPGNAGLKDQVLALRWIQQHIHHFGGDPKSVTLLGYSAGSVSIALHMLSPMSRGLFHRGICMSASPYGRYAYNTSDIVVAQRQARLLKCPETPLKDLVSCLREKPMMDFVTSYNGMFEFGWNPLSNWQIVVEQDHGQERFLIEEPHKTAHSGNFYKVPLISGITEFEFMSGAFFDLRNDTIRGMLNSDWERYAPIVLLYERGTLHSKEISAALRNEYLGGEAIENPGSLLALGRLYSDAIIGVGYNRFMRLMAPHTPIYTYYFRYKGRYSFLKDPETNKTFGAMHHDELIYLFQVPLISPLFNITDPENTTIERLTRMWTGFASTSNPNNSTDKYLCDLNWPLYNTENPKYLEIDEEMTIKTGNINEQRYKFWDKLFPIPTGDNKSSI